MKREDILRLAQTFKTVVEGKLKLDPVGKSDKDIDNDGDVDKSDNYLNNRRKAISTAMKKKGKMFSNRKESAKDLNTSNTDKALIHDCAKHVLHKEHGEGMCIPGMHTIVENEDNTAYVTHYDVLFDDKVVENVPVEDLEILVSESHMHTRKKKMKEDTESDLEEASVPVVPTKGDKFPDHSMKHVKTVDSKNRGADDSTRDSQSKQLKRSKGEEDFVKKHVIDAIDGEKGENDAMDAILTQMKPAPGRSNDQKTGDKKVVKPVKDTTK